MLSKKDVCLLGIVALLLALSACSARKMPGVQHPPGDENYPFPTTTKPDGTPLATQRPYTINGTTYTPLATAEGYREVGLASWYGPNFHGKSTSNGEKYDMEAMTAAHKTLPMNTWVRVSNINTGQNVVVRINDRGPFVDSRVIDLSKAAARDTGVLQPGTAKVEVVALGYRRQGTGTATVPAQYDQPASYNTGVFTVQVGAFVNQDNAKRLAEQLRAAYGSGDIQRYDRGDQIFYRVRVGKFSSLDDAKNMQQRMRAAGHGEAFAVGW